MRKSLLNSDVYISLKDRPGWEHLSAVRDERVHVISRNLTTSPRGIIGLSYFAKWFYPDKFVDIDPADIHKELLEKFYEIDYEGVWVYPNEK